ncbi:MAG: sulfate transporter family protein [Hyphomicrobiales bacterium]|nr:sulfate transporter family protein [Hyphomicrobiales bacterium]
MLKGTRQEHGQIGLLRFARIFVPRIVLLQDRNLLLQSARLAISQLFSKPFRKVFWSSIGYTILLLIAAWFLLESAISTLLLPYLGPWPWVATAILWLMGTGMFIGAGFLIAPVSAIFAGIFLDDIALKVETKYYPEDPPGIELPIPTSLWLAVKFTFLVVIANLIALLLVLLPGINFIIFFFLNGFLLGREFFQFAAMRFADENEVTQLRKANEATVFLGGMIIAGFMAVPLLNLATPIFAAALMVHIHKYCRMKKPDVRDRPLPQ